MIRFYDENEKYRGVHLTAKILLEAFHTKKVLAAKFNSEKSNGNFNSDLEVMDKIRVSQRALLLFFANYVSGLAKDRLSIPADILDLLRQASELVLMDLKKWMQHYKTSRIGVHFPKRVSTKKSIKREPPPKRSFGRIDSKIVTGPAFKKTESIDEYLIRGGVIKKIKVR